MVIGPQHHAVAHQHGDTGLGSERCLRGEWGDRHHETRDGSGD
jgi:hypothetical protein